ncbi:MAG: hypothetical protein AB9856_09660 [Cellulosilyticaceae bacterium]
MELKDFLTLKTTKRGLLGIAALVWGIAGYRVLSLGYSDLTRETKQFAIYTVIATMVFILFFKFIFSKMVHKHTKRILTYTKEKLSIFAFFDKKGYLIMGIMMSGGIGVRSLGIFNAAYLGAFYIGLGTALFLGGILFGVRAIAYNKTKRRYKVA